MSNPNLVRKSATSTISGESSFTEIAAAIGGSGGGGGTGKNYITTGSTFDGASTAGWSLTKATLDATTKVPNAAPSGSATGLSISTVGGGSQLSLSGYSLSLVSTGSTVAGDMLLSDAIALDQEAQSSVQTFSFFYKVASGSGNFSGTSGNTLGVAIYAVDGSQIGWIQPAGAFNIVQSSGVGKASGTFQVPAGCTSVRLAVYFPNSTASAITVYLDDFVLGPQTVQYGAPVTDWQTASVGNIVGVSGGSLAVGTGGGAIYSAKYRRVGDSAEVSYTLRIGTSGTSDVTGVGNVYLFPYPTGMSPSGLFSYEAIGFGEITVVGSAAPTNRLIAKAYTNGFILDSTDSVLLASGGNLYNNANTLSVVITYKVAGWSSTVQMSNDTDTRVVDFLMEQTGDQSIPTAASTKITAASTINKDTHGAWDSTNKRYVVPVAGDYVVTSQVFYAGTAATCEFRTDVFLNGSLARLTTYYKSGTAGVTSSVNGVVLLTNLKAGDYIEFYTYQTSGGDLTASGSGSLGTGGAFPKNSIQRLSGPSAIAATETVAATYRTNSAQTIPNNIDSVVLNPSTKEFDTHGMFVAGSGYNSVTGTWTVAPGIIVPVSGKYAVSWSAPIALPGSTAYEIFSNVGFSRNGVSQEVTQGGRYMGTSTVSGGVLVSTGSTVFNCLAGDKISLAIFQNSGASRGTGTDGRETKLSVVRVGN